jgi:putative RecB family exonuclease
MPTYSHSRLETYRNCPRQYKLQYIDKVEIEETESVEAFLGGRVHETLEKVYKDVRMTKLPSLDEVIAHYETIWDKNWHDGVNIVRTDYTAEHYRELGRRCLAEYYEKHHPFDESRTISVEHLVFFPLDEAKHYWIRGVIDRLSIAKDGAYEIHDYKTSGRLPTQDDVDSDRQLALYHIALERMWPDVKDIDLVWHYLVFGKEMRSRRTARQLRNLKEEVMDLIRTVENEKDFRPRESALCDWCAYPEYCPAKKHVALTAKLPLNKYLAEPGVKLVNQFADLQRRKSLLEDEIAQLREALIHYARENQVEVIRGNDHRVLVRIYKGLAFPGRDDPARADLERLVKELGLWEQVAVLSPVSLAKLVEGGNLDPQKARRIGDMGEETERPWVKLSKLRKGDEVR